MKYCESLIRYSRRDTIEVNVGKTPLGGLNPIRIQTMTNSLTSDVESTVQQIIDCYHAGAEYVRVTVPSKKDISCLSDITDNLNRKGYSIPVIADIHFNPEIAMLSVKHVDKIRINPGNFADSNKYIIPEYSEDQYNQGLQNVYEKFLPLINECRKYKTALRIGINHGSLSNRIISRFGDTPEGMVESAMEFLRICKQENFHQVVISMKASNTLVMVQATRLLVKKMNEELMHYPLHLGVTEAGEGEEGRIKSAVGIGALLLDGIGDTIRISLTEDPVNEIPVARKLIDYVSSKKNSSNLPDIEHPFYNPYSYMRRNTINLKPIGSDNPPVVCYTIDKITKDTLKELGWKYTCNEWEFNEQSPDYIFTSTDTDLTSLPENKGIVIPYTIWNKKQKREQYFPYFDVSEYLENSFESSDKKFLMVKFNDITPELIQKLKTGLNTILVLMTSEEFRFAEERSIMNILIKNNCQVPVIFSCSYNDTDQETFQIKSATDIGGIMIDGFGDGILLSNKNLKPQFIIQTAFNILQATRTRISKTEYISCPSCGRTMFNLQETTACIRNRTSHLKGLKIGIMGCIVNGIGEMADADYGYIGMGNNKITLYKGKQLMKKNIPEKDAVNELIKLIKEHGDWKEPKKP